MNTFNGRIAVVTGASSGIGLATARRLHRDGARLASARETPTGSATPPPPSPTMSYPSPP